MISTFKKVGDFSPDRMSWYLEKVTGGGRQGYIFLRRQLIISLEIFTIIINFYFVF